MGASHKAKYIWDNIIEKKEHQFANWKMLFVFKGGRLNLIKSIHSNLPMYFMSLFSLPTGVTNCTEKHQCDFL